MTWYNTDDWIQIDNIQIPKSPSLMSVNTITESEIDSICIDSVNDVYEMDVDETEIEIAFYNSFGANPFNLLDCDALEIDTDSEPEFLDFEYESDAISDFEDQLQKYKNTRNGSGPGKTRKRQVLVNKAQAMLNSQNGTKKAEQIERARKVTDLIVQLSKQGLRNSGLCKELESLKA